MPPIAEISVTELHAIRQESRALLDVREPDEYTDGHVPGAVLIPLGQLAARINDVPLGDPLYVICKSGGRSAQAVALLAAQSIDAVNVAGGTDAWRASGGSIATGEQPG